MQESQTKVLEKNYKITQEKGQGQPGKLWILFRFESHYLCKLLVQIITIHRSETVDTYNQKNYKYMYRLLTNA